MTKAEKIRERKRKQIIKRLDAIKKEKKKLNKKLEDLMMADIDELNAPIHKMMNKMKKQIDYESKASRS